MQQLQTETSMIMPFMMGRWWGMSAYMLRTVSPSNKVSQQYGVWIDQWSVPPGTWIEQQKLKQKEETHNSPDKSWGGWWNSTPRPPEVEGFPRYDSTDIALYMRMMTVPPPVDPTDKTQLELCEDAGANQEPTDFKRDSQLPHWDG